MPTTTQQRYVIIRGLVYRWEEKQPYTGSGTSLLGALEYDRESDAVRCHECGEWHSYLGNHVAKYHPDLTAREYKIKHGLTARHALVGERAGIALRNRGSRQEQTNSLAGYMAMVKRGERQPPKAPPSYHRITATLRNERNTCRDQCLFRLQNLVVDIGCVPVSRQIPRNLRDNLALHFGNVTNALKLLGVEPNKVCYTKDILIESLRDFYVLNQRLPRRREWGTGRLVTIKTYQNHFGSVAASYEAAGLALVAATQRAAAWTRNLKPSTPEQISDSQKKIWAERSPEERSRFMGNMAARRWAGISPEERAECMQRLHRQRAEKLAQLSPEERVARIQRMNEARALKSLNRDTAAVA